MSDPYIGELRLMAFNYPPKTWALCNGQLLPIAQNQPLFALLGTRYGGDGRVNFKLPDLRGRVPMHRGNGFAVGDVGGEETHALTAAEIPAHTHRMSGSATTAGAVARPANAFLGPAVGAYGPATQLTTLEPSSTLGTGSNQGHQNMQPYTVASWCICLTGSSRAGAEDERCRHRSSGRFALLASTSRQPTGRSATASCWRSRSTSPSSTSSAPPTAEMDRPRSRFPTTAVASPFTKAPGQGSRPA